MSKRSAFLLVVSNLFFLTAFSQGPVVLRINPADAKGGTVSQVFDSIGYIPLETTKKSLFGRIDQLVITDMYFIILDFDTNSILVFFRNGKFHCKIEGGDIVKKYSPTGIRFICVNKSKQEISFKVDQTKTWVFDFDGNKIREDLVPKSDFHYILSSDSLIYSHFNVKDRAPSEEMDYEVVWQANGNSYKREFPYTIRESPITNSDILRPSGSVFYAGSVDTVTTFFKTYDYNIYQLGPSSLTNKYAFVLPSDISLPGDFQTNRSLYNNRFLYLVRQNPKIVYGITHFYELGNLLFFKLKSGSFNNNSSFIYNTKSSQLLSVLHLSSDATNSFLPVFANNGNLTFSFGNSNFLATDGVRLYTSSSSLEMFTAKETKRRQRVRYNPALTEYFKKGSKKDNPVIIVLKPKGNI